MNVNKLLIDTLNFLNVPVKQGRYSGSSYPYITFFEVYASDTDFSDNKNETLEHRLQIDLFSKEDTTEYKKKIRKALKSNFYNVTSEDLFDGDINHVIFECYFYEDEEEEEE